MEFRSLFNSTIWGRGAGEWRRDGIKMFEPWGPKLFSGCCSSFNSSVLIRTSFESVLKRNKG